MPKSRDSQVTGRLQARAEGRKKNREVTVGGEGEQLVSGEVGAGKQNRK